TRHADVILPPPPPSRTAHYDLAYYRLSVRNVANFSPAAAPLDDGALDECEILLRLNGILAGTRADPDIAAMAEADLMRRVASVASATGRDSDTIPRMLTAGSAAYLALDLRLGAGRY